MANEERGVTSFHRFIDEVAAAKWNTFGAAEDTQVAGAEAFEAMRRHLLGLYQGVEAQHTFVDDGGQIVDCIPIEQQPSLRGSGGRIERPPSPPDNGTSAADDTAVVPMLSPDRKDRYGNVMWCPDGTIPMRRLALEELARFETLEHYHHKAPLMLSDEPVGRKPLPGEHLHATGAVWSNIIGGRSKHAIWQPACANQKQLSLSQCWYVAGKDTDKIVQTVEAGWIVYFKKFGTYQPCLFIFYTADKYDKKKCYNLDCKAFVQVGQHWLLGGALQPSVRDGRQYDLEINWLRARDTGSWWLFLGNTNEFPPVGYYPSALFDNGQMTKHATKAEYGGETADGNSLVWPPMGSGAFADENNPHNVASVWDILCYYDDGNGKPFVPDLAKASTQDDWYGIKGNSAAARGAFIFFGGPGGKIGY